MDFDAFLIKSTGFWTFQLNSDLINSILSQRFGFQLQIWIGNSWLKLVQLQFGLIKKFLSIKLSKLNSLKYKNERIENWRTPSRCCDAKMKSHGQCQVTWIMQRKNLIEFLSANNKGTSNALFNLEWRCKNYLFLCSDKAWANWWCRIESAYKSNHTNL